MLEIGHPAPQFSLPDAGMDIVSLSSLKGKRNVVLYFYPKDDTPGCTLQAQEFSDLDDEYEKHATSVFGISADDCLSHAAFRDKHGLSVQLLADTEHTACRKYGVVQEKEKDGVKRMCISRATFIIDSHGILRYAMHDVNPRGHAAEILKIIKELK
ncbi:MAG: peroxiredoxin [Burkholderiales bacterium]